MVHLQHVANYQTVAWPSTMATAQPFRGIFHTRKVLRWSNTLSHRFSTEPVFKGACATALSLRVLSAWKKTVNWESISKCDFELQLIQFWLERLLLSICHLSTVQAWLRKRAPPGCPSLLRASRSVLYGANLLSCQFDGFLAGNLLCRCAALHRIPGLLFVKAIARGSWQLRGGLNKKQWSRKGLLISYIQWNLIEFVPWSELLDKVQSWWSKESTSDLPVSEGCQQRFLQLMVVAPSPLAMLVRGPTDTLCKSRSTQSRFVN